MLSGVCVSLRTLLVLAALGFVGQCVRRGARRQAASETDAMERS